MTLSDYLYHQTERGVLYCGDCLEIMPLLADKSVDLVLTDPPYGINYEYDGYDDTKDNLIYLIKSFIPHIHRIGNISAIFTGVRHLYLYPEYDWIYAVCWNTTGSYGKMGFSQWQPVVFYGKDPATNGYFNDILKSDMTYISGGDGVGFRRQEKIDHPCPKPKNVIKHMICRLSNLDQIILDPFAGSGTTAVACINTKRRYILIEKEEKYCEIAKRRIETALDQTEINLEV